MNAPSNAPTTPADFQAWIDAAPFHQFLHMRVLEVDTEVGKVVLELPYQDAYQRLADSGQVHGGPLASLIDIAGTFAVAAKVGHGVPTINLRTDYLRPAVQTALVATAVVRRAGRSVALADIDVVDGEGRLIATGRGTWGTQEG